MNKKQCKLQWFHVWTTCVDLKKVWKRYPGFRAVRLFLLFYFLFFSDFSNSWGDNWQSWRLEGIIGLLQLPEEFWRFWSLYHLLYLKDKSLGAQWTSWFQRCGNDPIWLAHMFQMGWFNHQPVEISQMIWSEMPNRMKCPKQMDNKW